MELTEDAETNFGKSEVKNSLQRQSSKQIGLTPRTAKAINIDDSDFLN